MFSINVIVFEITSLLIAILNHKEDPFYSRMVYHIICLGLIFMNNISNLSRYLLLCFFATKIIIFGVVISYYNFNQSKLVMFFDIFMMIFSFGSIFFNYFLKRLLIQFYEKNKKKNYFLEKRLKNILNSMKHKIISINLKEKNIFFNTSFIELIDKTFFKEEFVNYIFDRIPEEEFSIQILSRMYGIIKRDDKRIFQLLENKDENKQTKFTSFEVKILILNKIFSTFIKENEYTTQSSETLNIFDFFREKVNSNESNLSINYGKYKILNGLTENIFEISCIKTVYDNNQEFIEIIFDDITSFYEAKYNDNYERKKSYQKIADNFQTSLNSMTFFVSKILSNIEPLSKEKNFNNKNDISNDIKIIEGQINFISSYKNDIMDYNKDFKDFDINLNLIDLTEIINESFNILKCLIYTDSNKKDNINLVINIDKNLPKLIKNDGKRIKQVLVNLFSNSFKFTYFGFIKLNVKYERSLIHNSFDEIKFSVDDTGIGINQELQTQLKNDLNTENSFNNGLSICQKIVSKIGKTINCSCENGVTKFFFSIFNFTNYVAPTSDNIIKKSNDDDLNKPKSSLVKNRNLEIILENDYQKEEESLIIEKSSHKKSFNIKNASPMSQYDFNVTEKNFTDLNDINLPINYSLSKDRIGIEIINDPKLKIELNNCLNKEEEMLIKLLENRKFSKLKIKFLTFLNPFISYINDNLSNPKDLKFVILVGGDEGITSLSYVISKYFNEKSITNIKIIKLNDGIEALNILYYDNIFFKNIKIVICEKNMRLMSGDLFLRTINHLNNNPFKKIYLLLYGNNESDGEINFENLLYLNNINTNLKMERLFRIFDNQFNYS